MGNKHAKVAKKLKARQEKWDVDINGRTLDTARMKGRTKPGSLNRKKT